MIPEADRYIALLDTISFPKAKEFNEELKILVDDVVKNWRILCEDGGDGLDSAEESKRASAQGVLDVLYRAAAKSFHSTSILRHLFTVHASLDELDLASKALETYINLVKKGRARVVKSGIPEPNLDNDEVVLKTASQGIRYLCSHGGKDSATAAWEIGIMIKQLLGELEERVSITAEETLNGLGTAGTHTQNPQQDIPKQILASAYQAVGISQAHWARTVCDVKSREDIRRQALLNLRTSLSSDFNDTENPQSLFALGLLLAESRELNKAVSVVKHALRSHGRTPAPKINNKSEQPGLHAGGPTLAGPSIAPKHLPLWHLLVLLLSAEQEFDTALDTCEAIIRHFVEATESQVRIDSRSTSETQQHENLSSSEPASPFHDAIIHDRLKHLKRQEKEALLQIKLTYLALLEATEDSEAAVNASDELLQLFSRMYGNWGEIKPRTVPALTIAAQPPKSSSGTMRSIGNSLFGKSKITRRSLRQLRSHLGSNDLNTIFVPPQPVAGERNVEQPTAGISSGRKLHKRSSSSNRAAGPDTTSRRRGLGSSSSAVDEDSLHLPAWNGTPSQMIVQGHKPLTVDHPHQQYQSVSTSQHHRGSQGTLEVPYSAAPQIRDGISTQAIRTTSQGPLDTEKSQGINLLEQSPRQHIHPPSGFSPMEVRKELPGSQVDHSKYQGLIRIWLFAAGLYRRAALYEDARGAIDEAWAVMESYGLEATIEAPIPATSDDKQGSHALNTNELKAEILTERGFLAQAQFLHQDALDYFEKAVSCCVDHPLATVGLCNALLDFASGRTTHISDNNSHTSEDPAGPFASDAHLTSSMSTSDLLSTPLEMSSSHITAMQTHMSRPVHPAAVPGRESPEIFDSGDSFLELDRFAARDRAYGLLLSLTKLGTGWDLSSAWFALSRVYEQSGQMDKAREVLWWCVELEDKRPIRHWRNAELRGYVL